MGNYCPPPTAYKVLPGTLLFLPKIQASVAVILFIIGRGCRMYRVSNNWQALKFVVPVVVPKPLFTHFTKNRIL